MPITHNSAIQVAAEIVHQHATELGKGCALPEGAEALKILTPALAIAIAEAVGPNEAESRLQDAFRIGFEQLWNEVRIAHRFRYARLALGDGR